MQAVTITQITPPELEALIEVSLKKILSTFAVPSIPSEGDELLTIQQAADLLKLSVTTIYGLVSKAEIPVNKRGKRLYFSKGELTAWVKEGRKKTLTEIQEAAHKHITKKGG